MENQVPWELRPWRAHNYYDEELGEFEKPAPPKFITTTI
jgi:NADH dehydrogenase (ubiquinone) 1 alpha subcomplex subunit 9